MKSFAAICIASLLAANSGIAAAEDTSMALTADTEGHVGPCESCPGEKGLGGLAGRATIVEQQRDQHPQLLLLDAGNALVGDQSLSTGGKVIVAAYNRIGYDAVNISHHDFYRGKEATLAVLEKAEFATLSANLLDEGTGEPLLEPYVVKHIGDERIAVIGVTQRPVVLDIPGPLPPVLQGLREQLKGIEIAPPKEALAKCLPEARGKADRVILLYYGSPIGLAEIRDEFGGQLDAIGVGGMRPDAVPQDAEPPVIGTSMHGRHVAVLDLDEAAEATVRQVPVGPTIEPDPAMVELLADYGFRLPAADRVASAEQAAPASTDLSVAHGSAAMHNTPLVEMGPAAAAKSKPRQSRENHSGNSLNLLRNRGNEAPLEAGRIPSWTPVIGENWQARTDDPAPKRGKAYFYAGEGRTAELRQDVDLSQHAKRIDDGSTSFRINAHLRDYEGRDTAQIILECRDASNSNVLGKWNSDAQASPRKWQEVVASFPIPAGTRWIRVRLISERHSGISSDGYFDDLSLRLFTEPMTGVAINFQPPPRHWKIVEAETGQVSKSISGGDSFVPLEAGEYFVTVEPFGRTRRFRLADESVQWINRKDVAPPPAWSVTRGEELLRNPSNEAVRENGAIPGWTVVTGDNWRARTKDPAPLDGETYFYAGEGSRGELYQDVNVSQHSEQIDEGSLAVCFECYGRNYQGRDTTRTILEFRDAENSEILNRWDSSAWGDPEQWRQIAALRFLPPRTRWIRVRLIAERHSGTSNDGYFDALSLRLVRERMSGVVLDSQPPPRTWTVLDAESNREITTQSAGQNFIALEAGTYYVIAAPYGQTSPFELSQGVVKWVDLDEIMPPTSFSDTTAAQADFVFLVDGSISMEDDTKAVRAGLDGLVSALDATQVDSRFAVVVFGGKPELVLDFTSSVQATKKALSRVHVGGAVPGFQNDHNKNPEAALEAIRAVLGAVNKPLVHEHVGGDGFLRCRANARKNLVIATDEDSDQPSWKENRLPDQRGEDPPSEFGESGWQLEVDTTARAVIQHRVFLNMLINPGDAPSRLQFGDPSSDVANENLLGFQPAATLDNLRRRGFTNSLQAQVLAGGLIGRTFSIQRVDDPLFVKNFYAAKVAEIAEQTAIAKLSVATRPGQVPKSLMPAVLLILDSSNSMREEVDGVEKQRIAREVVDEILTELPQKIQLGLRLFGHWGRWLPRQEDPDAAPLPVDDPRLNKDSQLVVPIDALTAPQRQRIDGWLTWAQPRGQTPLVYSLLQAKDDFPNSTEAPQTIVLVSDGKETGGGKLENVAAAYRNSDIDIVIHVVGFDIKDTDAEQQLRRIATLGRGNYFAANDAGELSEALRSAVRDLRFAVLETEGSTVVARGVVDGASVTLAPGEYRVRLDGSKTEPLRVTVAAGQSLQLGLDEQGRLQSAAVEASSK